MEKKEPGDEDEAMAAAKDEHDDMDGIWDLAHSSKV